MTLPAVSARNVTITLQAGGLLKKKAENGRI